MRFGGDRFADCWAPETRGHANEVDLRGALKYALDRETILGGFGKVGNDTPVMNAYLHLTIGCGTGHGERP